MHLYGLHQSTITEPLNILPDYVIERGLLIMAYLVRRSLQLRDGAEEGRKLNEK